MKKLSISAFVLAALVHPSWAIAGNEPELADLCNDSSEVTVSHPGWGLDWTPFMTYNTNFEIREDSTVVLDTNFGLGRNLLRANPRTGQVAVIDGAFTGATNRAFNVDNRSAQTDALSWYVDLAQHIELGLEQNGTERGYPQSLIDNFHCATRALEGMLARAENQAEDRRLTQVAAAHGGSIQSTNANANAEIVLPSSTPSQGAD